MLLAVRLAVFAAALAVPGFWLYQALGGLLGPDPGKVLLERLGQGALCLLLLTLALSPLRCLSGWPGWLRLRRQLGLWCFAYACLHLLAWLAFLLGFDPGALGTELAERPYILVGFAAWALLLPLALTSNRTSMRRLGAGWQRLHRLVYLALVLALLHFLWVVRSDLGEWLVYAAVAALLLALRWPWLLARLSGVFRRAG